MSQDNRNFLIFIVITLVLVVVYEQFVIAPMDHRRQVAAAQAQAVAAAQAKQGLAPNGQPVAPQLSRAQALAAGPRIVVDTPTLAGSISLTGGELAATVWRYCFR
jgi:YidC/Oxa1 family membrane protein insertase